MKRILNLMVVWFAIVFSLSHTLNAQPLSKGLLWEITGNGLTKPSYLYGTMHVSSKLAFNLSDSFFIAIKNSDRVALESTPENWLEEFLSTEFMSHIMRTQSSDGRGNDDPIATSRFTWFKEYYGKDYIARALSTDPDLLNQLMFRHSGSRQDFEEDTYLDLYIFQTASRLKKPVLSVEDLDESLRLVMQAYTKMYPEDKERKYNEKFDELLEDYYRQADLYRLDSLMMAQGYSESYLDNMLFKRNQNMVNRMDSFMKSGSLFTGVGASHLPGEKGVISLLRKMGYNVRAVNLGQRNAAVRSKLDKIVVPSVYQKFTSPDGMFSVDAPGKLLIMPDNSMTQQYLYTDMMNGSFFSVVRMRHLTPFLGYTADDFRKSVDSLLYENIPGDILSMKEIQQNGFPAVDIVNKTKRGNLQRYRLVFTPFELFMFKAGGKDQYVKKNAAQFFNSIVVNKQTESAQAFSSNKEGFEINLPVKPVANYELSTLKNYTPNTHIYQSTDNKGVNYAIFHQMHINTYYMEEDSVEMNIVERGYTQGAGLKRNSYTYFSLGGYPALKCTYKHNEKPLQMAALYVIRGAHVYAVTAWCQTDEQLKNALATINTFRLVELISNEGIWRTDTIHKFKVYSPIAIPPDVNAYSFSFKKRDDKKDHEGLNEYINYFDAETGERVELRWQRLQKYYSAKDTATFWTDELEEMNPDSDYVQKVKYYTKDGASCIDAMFTDTNSSRVLMVRSILKGRFIYTLTVNTDTISKGNNFTRKFLESFTPVNDDTSFNPFENKNKKLLTDLLSDDSATYAQARELLDRLRFRKQSYKPLAETIGKLKDDKYKKDLRNQLVSFIGQTKEEQAIPYLRDDYKKAGDDYDYQVAILKALAGINTVKSYKMCKDLLLAEPPFASNKYLYNGLFEFINTGDSAWNRSQFLPDVLKLAQHEEYKDYAYEMLAEAIDSNKIQALAYQTYLNGIINDAKKALRQELTADDKESFRSNSELETYNRILIKHYTNEQVKDYFEKQLKAKNHYVKANAIALLLKNNRSVHDTIVYNMSENLDSRINFYFELKALKIQDKMPAKFRTQDALVYCYSRNAVKPSWGDNKLDSIVLLSKTSTYYRGKTGTFYYFKYKLKKSDDWKVYVCGLQVQDTTQYRFLYTLNGSMQEVFDDKKPIEEQFAEAIELKKEGHRRRRISNNDYDFDFAADDE